MNKFILELEELKKEVWFLKNKTIKNLIEEVGLITGGNLDSTLIQRLNALEQNFTTFENGLNSLRVDVLANSQNIYDVTQYVSELATNISRVQEDVTALNNEIANLKNTDDLLSGEINTINDNIASLQEELSTHIDGVTTLFNDLNSSVVTLQNRVNTLETTVSELSVKVEQGGSNADLQAQIDALKEKDEDLDFEIVKLLSTDDALTKMMDSHYAKIMLLREDVEEYKASIDASLEDLKNKDLDYDNSIENLTAKDLEHDASIENLNSKVGEIEEDVNSLSAEQSSIKDLIEQNSTSLETMQTSINGHEERIGVLEQSDASQEEDLSSLNETTASLSTSIANLEAVANANSQIISSLQAEIETLKAQIENGTGGSGGSGETVELLYDMRSEDAAINMGLTSGMVGYSYYNLDLTKYSKIRIYASVEACDAQQEIVLANRYKTDATIVTVASSPKKFYFFKILIPTNLKRIQPMGYSSWTWSSEEGALSVVYGGANEDVFIYRIEGII